MRNADMRGGRPEIKKQRESGLELFRVIVMLLIIAHHYVVNSGLLEMIRQDLMAPRSLFLLCFGAWGKTGINCFVLISGYFMCKSNISIKKFAKLLLQVLFYKVVIYGVFVLTGYEGLSLRGIVTALSPITSLAQGFVGCYLVFFLCIPFLNTLIRHCSQMQHLLLVILMLTVYTVLGSVPGFTVSMNYVTWFVILYLCASYIRCYPHKIFENTRAWGAATLVCLALGTVSVLAMSWLGTKVGKPALSFFFLSDSNRILAVATGISSFLFFKNLKLGHIRWINHLGGCTFGVLLIHANSETMRNWLWKDLLGNIEAFNSPWLIVHAVGSVLGIFVVCAALETLRQCILEKPFFQLWDAHYPKIAVWFEKKTEKLLERIQVKE
jgi:hypothetical protein